MSRTFPLLAVAFSVLLLTTTYAQEDIRREVSGFWQGRVKFTSDDSEASASYLSMIERFRDTGFKITKNLRYLGGPGNGFKNQTITYLYPSGRSRSTEYVENQPVAFGWGKWSIAGSTLSITETWETENTTYRMTSKHSLRDATRMRLHGTLSAGMRWSGSVAKTLDLD